jgi:hypothetical protein
MTSPTHRIVRYHPPSPAEELITYAHSIEDARDKARAERVMAGRGAIIGIVEIATMAKVK